MKDFAGLFSSFFQNSRDGMYISDTSGRFIQVNLALLELLEYQERELLGKKVQEIYALPMERRRFRWEVDNQGAVSNFRIKLKTGTGEEIPCAVDAVAIRDEDGEPSTYMGIVRKIPGSLAPEFHDTGYEGKHFSLALRGANDGLWEWDIRRDRVFYSSRWKSILGHSPGEIGSSIREWLGRVHPQDSQRVSSALEDYLAGKRPHFSVYFRMAHKKGHEIWVMARGTGEFDENGRARAIAGSLTDVSGHIGLLEKIKTQERSHKVLSQYFDSEAMEAILKEEQQDKIGKVLPSGILVLKINGIQGQWGRLGPEQYRRGLNEILTDLMDMIYSHGGKVNKLLGDTILARFTSADHQEAASAYLCSKEVNQYRRILNDALPEDMPGPVGFSMGLTHGPVFSGTLGSVHRLDFALLGGPVDRAFRLCRMAEAAKVPLLMGSNMAARIGVNQKLRQLRRGVFAPVRRAQAPKQIPGGA